LLLGGGRLTVAEPADGGATTVRAFFGVESSGTSALKSSVAAPTSLTVNSRLQDGHLFGISSRSSNGCPQLGQVRIISFPSLGASLGDVCFLGAAYWLSALFMMAAKSIAANSVTFVQLG
jgi:hypothetical protein